MVTRTQLVADILSQQQAQRSSRPIRTPLQGLGGLGADFLTIQAQKKAEEEREEQREAANQAQAQALSKILGTTGEGRQSAIAEILGGGQLDEAPGLRNALIQSALQQPGQRRILKDVGGVQRFESGERVFPDVDIPPDVNVPASIREFDTLVKTAELSPEEEQKAARIRLKLTAGEGVSTPEDRLFFAEIQSRLKVQETQQLSQVKREEGFIDTAFGAAGEIQDINRAFELLETVQTGGLVAAQKAVTDFFGTTPGDVGELNNLLAQNVLNGLSAFTGAISEGERAFIETMSTSLSQGGQVNKAQLRRLKRVANNAIRNGKRILERRAKSGDENAINALADFNSVLKQGTGEIENLDFSTMTDQQLRQFLNQ